MFHEFCFYRLVWRYLGHDFGGHWRRASLSLRKEINIKSELFLIFLSFNSITLTRGFDADWKSKFILFLWASSVYFSYWISQRTYECCGLSHLQIQNPCKNHSSLHLRGSLLAHDKETRWSIRLLYMGIKLWFLWDSQQYFQECL